MSESGSSLSSTSTLPSEAKVVEHVLYVVPRENHDAMLQICKQANEMFMQLGVLRYDVYQLNNTDVPMEGFSNIASVMSAKQNEEVWIDSLYYKDRQHMSEVKARMEKDERMEPLMKQSIDLMPSGAKMVIGEFDSLSL